MSLDWHGTQTHELAAMARRRPRETASRLAQGQARRGAHPHEAATLEQQPMRARGGHIRAAGVSTQHHGRAALREGGHMAPSGRRGCQGRLHVLRAALQVHAGAWWVCRQTQRRSAVMQPRGWQRSSALPPCSPWPNLLAWPQSSRAQWHGLHTSTRQQGRKPGACRTCTCSLPCNGNMPPSRPPFWQCAGCCHHRSTSPHTTPHSLAQARRRSKLVGAASSGLPDWEAREGVR